MIYWVDAQLPPQLADWLKWTFKVEAYALRDLNLRDADDKDIFQQARQANLVIISKDSDFVEMVLHFSPPPQLLWVTCDNVYFLKPQPRKIQGFQIYQKIMICYHS